MQLQKFIKAEFYAAFKVTYHILIKVLLSLEINSE